MLWQHSKARNDLLNDAVYSIWPLLVSLSEMDFSCWAHQTYWIGVCVNPAATIKSNVINKTNPKSLYKKGLLLLEDMKLKYMNSILVENPCLAKFLNCKRHFMYWKFGKVFLLCPVSLFVQNYLFLFSYKIHLGIKNY